MPEIDPPIIDEELLEDDDSIDPNPIPSAKEAEILPEHEEMLHNVTTGSDWEGIKTLINNHIATANASLYNTREEKYADQMEALFALLGSFDEYA